MNSLMQSLVSCPAFNARVAVLRSSTDSHKRDLLNELAALVERHSTPDAAASDSAMRIIEVIVAGYKKEATRLHNNLLIGNQECPYQGFNLLTSIAPELEELFSVRYSLFVKCRACGHGHSVDDPPDTSVRIFDETRDVHNYIRTHTVTPEDYRCEKCGASDAVQQIYRLARLGEIIVVVFNKYTRKYVKFFPDIMLFESRAKCTLEYRPVAQIEHSGTMSGGHYVARCLRSDGVYLFNDSSVIRSKLEPTPNTYMVFYHLFESRSM